MQSLHPLVLLPREALKVAQPLRHYGTFRRKTYESHARHKLRGKARPVAPQEGHNDSIKTAKTSPAGSFSDGQQYLEQCLPTDQELEVASFQGRLGLSKPERTEFLQKVALAVPWNPDEIAGLAQKYHVQPQHLADLARLMYPRLRANSTRSDLGEHMLRAASKLHCPQATLDMAEISYGPAWRSTMHDQWGPKSPHRAHLEKIGTNGEGSMEAMMLSGILREAHNDRDTANEWYDRVWHHWQSLSKSTRLRKPSDDALQDDLSKRRLNRAVGRNRALSHPAARALMLKGRNLYEDPEKSLEESQHCFEKAAEEFDDPMAHTFLAVNYRNLSLRTRIHHATKGAMSGESLASEFLSGFYETGYTNLGAPSSTRHHASPEWEMREVKPTWLEWLFGPRKLADTHQDVKQWWREDVGAGRRRRDLNIYWSELAALQTGDIRMFFPARAAGQGYQMAARAAEALEGDKMAQFLVLRQGYRRYEQFARLVAIAENEEGNLEKLEEHRPEIYKDLREFVHPDNWNKMEQARLSNKYLQAIRPLNNFLIPWQAKV